MTKFAQLLSRAIRILRGNRDESARASHLVVNKEQFAYNELLQVNQAEREKFFQSTFFERKSMSTKTAFKRVALVAVAALAIGGVSAVSAYALPTAATVTGVTQSLGTITLKTAPVTGGTAAVWTESATFTITGTTLAAAQTVAITEANTGTSTATNVVATAGTYTLAAADVTSPTSATFTTNIVFTAASGSYANYLAALGTQILQPTATVTGTVSPSQTVPNASLTFTSGDGTATAPFATGNGVAGVANYVTITGVPGVAGTRALVSISGASATINTPTPLTGSTSVVIPVSATSPITIFTPTAGTIVANIYNETGAATGIYSSTASATVTITVNAGAQSGVYNAGNSTVYGTTAVNASANSTTDSAFSASGVGSTANPAAQDARFDVAEADALGIALSTGNAVPVSISASIGAVQTTQGTSVGSFASVSAPTNGAQSFWVAPDGRIGTSTVTISINGAVVKTYSITFSGTTVAKLTATANDPYIALAPVTGYKATAFEGIGNGVALNSTNTGAAVSVVAADANGNAISNLATSISVSSSNTAVATVGTVQWDSVNSVYFAVISGVSEGAATITFADAATGLVKGTANIWVTSAVVNSVVAASDAQSYDPGTKVLYTLTATDAKGNPVADGTYTALLGTVPASNVALQGFSPAVNVTFAAGVNTATIYSPVNSANVAIAGGVLGTGANIVTATQGTKLNEVDFSTTGSSDTAANAATDAANEATDAANAATDAANAAADSADAATQAAQDAGDKADAALAAVTALSQQVTSVLAKVAALSALLVRVVKKVKA